MSRKLTSDVDYRLIPLGTTVTNEGCYFSVWSPKAESIIIHIYNHDEIAINKVPLLEMRGSIWYGFIPNVGVGDLYSIEALGEEDPDRGLYFKKGRFLVDPYAKAINKPYMYNQQKYLNDNEHFIPKAVIIDKEFDWQGTQKPSFGRDNLIIYEANVKGFTQLNEELPLPLRGKYLGICHSAIIAHLKKLGITAIQLNPIAAFMSEPHLVKHGLVNYWGYNPVSFMAPDPRYAVDPLKCTDEFRTMVRELHKNGIAVILDVVFNHTAEGGRNGPVLSMKGLDAANYYTFKEDLSGKKDFTNFYDVTGCGNTVNAQSNPTLNLILDSLIYWVKWMQVDGFRFDLGVTVCRESHGNIFHEYDKDSAFLKSCFCIDRLAQSIKIAEPWDVGPGGYRLGQFPTGWSEQNDKFRDCVRRFWRGDQGIIGEFATRIMGSRDIFQSSDRSINASVNFVTYHDGFTLEDLVSYAYKHNEANCENNIDGSNENFSSNQGIEGHTDDPEIIERRWQLKRNMMATVLISQGIPHLLSGDEFSKTQNGNNNGYCQDNSTCWNHWDYNKQNREFIEFIGRITRLRHDSQMLRELNLQGDPFHLHGFVYKAKWFKEDGQEMDAASWNDPKTHVISLTLGSDGSDRRECWCFIFNQLYGEVDIKMPAPADGMKWEELIDTSVPTGKPREDERFGVDKFLVKVPCIKVFKLSKDTTSRFESKTKMDSVRRHFNRSEKTGRNDRFR